MRIITDEELKDILEAHKKWLNFEACGERADFSFVDFKGHDLLYVNLTKADLHGADLSGINLSDCCFRFANLLDTNLSNCNLRNADLYGCNLSCANLTNADLSCANLIRADFCESNLSCAVLNYAKLNYADLKNVNLTEADLSGCDLECSDLSYATLINCNLCGANFSGTKLHGINTGNNLYQLSVVGSTNRLVSYFVKEDMVVCGDCECEQENTLENFKKRVESVYGENGKTPNKVFYEEYQLVIDFFTKVKNMKRS